MKVRVLPVAYEKMMMYAEHANGEVSGLGFVDIVSDEVQLSEVVLLEQECTGGHTEMDWDAVFSKFIPSLKTEDVLRLRCWWHSHNDFGTFFSGVDTATIASYGAQGVDYLLAVCVNKKREYTARFDVWRPVHLVAEKVELYIPQTKDEALYAATKKEVAEKVRIIMPKADTHGQYNMGVFGKNEMGFHGLSDEERYGSWSDQWYRYEKEQKRQNMEHSAGLDVLYPSEKHKRSKEWRNRRNER